MNSIWYFIYNVIVFPLLRAALFLFGNFHTKIRLSIQGRKNLFQNLKTGMERINSTGPRFWIHSSSMGEFEQARPLIENLKRKFPLGSVIVTVFSPSAYDHLKDYKEADYLGYLPLDSKKNANRFLDLVKPDAAIVIRHDIWPNHLYQLQKRHIPCILANCSISLPPSAWHKLFPGASRFIHGAFDEIYTISHQAKDYCLAHNWGRGKVEMIGDTRYDQVALRAKRAEDIVEPLRKFKDGRPGFVMGSTWPTDENVLFPALAKLQNDGIKLWMVIAPHEPTPAHLAQIESNLQGFGLHSHRFSELDNSDVGKNDILIIDKIGILASLYALGELCFVGGAFGPGIHNVLEPAALGKAVIFGPRNKNSFEAGRLISRGVGFACNNIDEIYETLKTLLEDPSKMKLLGEKAEALVEENLGAADRITQRLTNLIK